MYRMHTYIYAYIYIILEISIIHEVKTTWYGVAKCNNPLSITFAFFGDTNNVAVIVVCV